MLANSLASLTGLDSLASVGEYLYIRSNYALTSLTGLENLASVGEYLRIRYNGSLTSLTGLNNLTSVGTYLTIEDNVALPTCEAELMVNNIGVENIGGIIDIHDGNCDACTCD